MPVDQSSARLNALWCMVFTCIRALSLLPFLRELGKKAPFEVGELRRKGSRSDQQQKGCLPKDDILGFVRVFSCCSSGTY